jgi:hypothetical protein
MKSMSKTVVVAAAIAALSSPAFAQSVARTPGGDDPAPSAPGPYAGADKPSFYDVDARVAALEARLGAMPRAARSQLNSVKAFLAQQRARHGGELRDWDREHATSRLNRIEAMLG